MECLGYSYLENMPRKPVRRSKAARLAASSSPHDPGSSQEDPSPSQSNGVLATPTPNLEAHSLSSVTGQSSLFGMAQEDTSVSLAADEHLQDLLSGLIPDDLLAHDTVFDFSFLPSTQPALSFTPQTSGDASGWGTNLVLDELGSPDLVQPPADPRIPSFATAVNPPTLGGRSPAFDAHPLPMPQYAALDLAPDRPAALTSGQASLFNALLSLGPSTVESSPTITLTSSSTATPDSSQWSPWLSPGNNDDDGDSATSEESDLEGFKDLVLSTPALDSSVESNSLPFVMQSYANWLNRTIYEPLKMAHSFQTWLTRRYAHSEDSRVNVMLFSRLLDKVWTKDASAADFIPAGSVLRQWFQRRAVEASQTLTSRDQVEMTRAMDEAVEIISVQRYTGSITGFVELMTATAPLFRLACPEPPHEPIDLAAKLIQPQINLRHFALMDILTSTVLVRPMLFRYHVQYDRALCEGILEVKDMGLQWLFGLPNQIALILARMNMLRDDFAPNVDPLVVAEIERELKEFKSSPGPTTDAFLMVTRLGVQECWRLVTLIYLYMGLCGANAKDPRVEKVQKSLVRLLEGIKPGRKPYAFLIPAMAMTGVATSRERERCLIRERMLSLRECCTIGTCEYDSVIILEDIWARTSAERPAVWGDVRISVARVLGL